LLKACQYVFAIGGCAYITDPNTGIAYPPTAQHAVNQAKLAAENIICEIQQGPSAATASPTSSATGKVKTNKRAKKFNYKTKGIMALIGKRNGVGVLYGYKVHGFSAWWLWRLYYLGNLPTLDKRVRVMVDWIIDLLFKRDVTRLKVFSEGKTLL
jgi:NADH dehydrogenase